MLLTVTADLHGELPVIEPCDLLLIAGDILPWQNHFLLYQKEWLETTFYAWLKTVPAKEIVFIAGNHDKVLERYPVPDKILTKAAYLQDSSVEKFGYKIYGSPWSLKIGDWAFSLTEDSTSDPQFAVDFTNEWHRIDFQYIQKGYNLKNRFNLIPDDTDILLTHSPPYGIADVMSPSKMPVIDDFSPQPPWDKDRLGSPALRAKIETIKPQLVCFGHVHESYGIWEKQGIKYLNAAYLNGDYHPSNPPITVELPDKAVGNE